MTTGSDLLALSPVMPVVVIDDADDAVPTARALLAERDRGHRADPAHAERRWPRSSASRPRSRTS